jgi:hypothetical protein
LACVEESLATAAFVWIWRFIHPREFNADLANG